jgi:acetyl esterase
MVQKLRKARKRLTLHVSALRSLALDSVAHAFMRARFGMPDLHPRKFDVELVRDVVYGSTRGRAHKLDVYVPSRAKRPLPVVMYVHGGGFSMLSKETHRVMALPIASRGYLTFNVNYRLGPRHLYPRPLEDVTEALLWVARHCKDYGGDPTRIVLAGESAGGNLVTALAVMSSYERPEPFARRLYEARIPIRGVVATYPILDFEDVERMKAHPRVPRWAKTLMLDSALSYLGADYDEAARKSPLASPLLILESQSPQRPLPPFFVPCGTRDMLLAHARRLTAALHAHGADCELHVSPGEIHGYDAMLWRPAAKEKWRATHSFLERATAHPPHPRHGADKPRHTAESG